MKFFYHPPESPHDVRYDFHWEVLRSALEVTEKKYGPFEMTPTVMMTEERQLREILKKDPMLTVMIRETNEDFEKKLTPVRIPIDRNLIGYRIFLIRGDNQWKFLKTKSLTDLKKITLGQGKGWGDVEILENAGFKVTTEVYYDDLFKSLDNGKFEAFPRGVTEIEEELKKFKKLYRHLAIEENFLIYYPLPTYFWFPKSNEGKGMAQRVEEGFRTLIKNGHYQKIFDKYYAASIAELGLKRRKVIHIENPFLPSTVPYEDKELWYNPF